MIRVRVRRVDDCPEAVYDAHEHDDDERLANPLWQCPACGLDLAAGYRGLVGLGVGAEGAVVWWGANEQRDGP